MTIQLGVVMDPISAISYKKDTTMAMLWAAQDRGWQLHYMEQSDMYLMQGEARANTRPLQVARDPEQWYTMGDAEDKPLAELDVILMRKDPPVDDQYLYDTHVLGIAQQAGALIVNDPQGLRDYNEKLAALLFPQCCPPTLVSRDPAALKAFVAEHGEAVLKPLDGMGGRSIFRVKAGDPNTNVILETLVGDGRLTLAQRFIPGIKDGDKRVLLVDGEPVDYALARIPQGDEFRGNLAAGGRGEGRPLSERDRWIATQVGPEMKRRGMLFVGLDVIGDYLTEVNVTSPTCVRELDAQFGLNIAALLFDAIEKKLA